MKFKYIFLLSVFIITSCDKSIDELNENPNSPTSANYDLILTGLEVGNAVLQTGEMVRKTGIFSGQYTGIDRSHLQYSTYSVSSTSFNSQWNEVYVDVISNSRTAEAVAIDQGVEGVSIGIIKIIRAMAFGTATSLWGDIPFDEAGYPDVENPVFEPQSVVYEKIQNLLDEAIVDLSKGTGRPPSGSDIHFDGSPDQWKAVANSLKARYYMHSGDYNNANSYAKIGIISNTSSLVVPHGTSNDDANLTYQFFEIGVRGSDLKVSDFMTSMLNTSSSNYRGNSKTNESGRNSFMFTSSGGVTIPNTSSGFYAIDSPASIITYTENLLILAESHIRLGDTLAAIEALNTHRGNLSSLFSSQYDAYTLSDFQNSGIENSDGLTTEKALLREILEERYVSLFNTTENFSDTRRTYKELDVRVKVIPNNGNELPQRFLYAQTEIDRNSNVPSPIPGFFEPTTLNK
jgi:hypothetical protein